MDPENRKSEASNPELQHGAEVAPAAAPRIASLVAFHAATALRLLAAAAIISLAAHVLNTMLQHLRAAAPAPAIRLNPVPNLLRDNAVTLSGIYEPNAILQIQVNDRIEGVTYTGADGAFHTEVRVPRQVSSIRLFPPGDADESKGASARVAVRSIGEPLLAPSIPSVLAIPSGYLLLGFADADAAIMILDGEQIVSRTVADDNGLFAIDVSDEVNRNRSRYTVKATAFAPAALSRSVPLVEAMADARLESISRSTVLDLRRAGRKIEMVLESSARLPYISRLLEGNLQGPRMLDGIFGGLVSLWPRIERREVAVAPGGKVTVRFAMELGEKEEFIGRLGLVGDGKDGPGHWPLLTPNDSFSVVWDDAPPVWFSPLPNAMEQKRATWTGPGSGVQLGFSAPVVAARDDRKPEADPPPSLKEILDRIRFPIAANLIANSVLKLVPFFWLVLLLRKYRWFMASPPDNEGSARSRLIAVCLLLALISLWNQISSPFYLSALLPLRALARVDWSPSMIDVPFWACWLSLLLTLPPAAKLLGRRADGWLEDIHVDRPGRPAFLLARRWILSIPFAAAAAWLVWAKPHRAAWLAPYLDRRATAALDALAATLPSWPAVAATALAVYLFAGAGLAFSLAGVAVAMLAFGFTIARDWAASGLAGGLTVAGLSILVLILCVSPARALWPRPKPGVQPWRRFLLLIPVLLCCLVFAPPKWGLWLGGAVAVWAVLWLAAYLLPVREGTSGSWGVATGGYRLIAGIALIALTYPAYPPDGARAIDTGLRPLLFELDRLLPLVPLVALIPWLGRRREDPHMGLARDLVVGPSLFALFLIGVSGRIFWVPVPLIVGFLLARFWLFRKLADCPDPTAAEARPQRLRALMDCRWLARMARSYRRAQDRKLEKGELAFEQHRKLIEEFENSANGPASQPAINPDVRSLALALGPTGDPWADARMAVGYGLPLSLPCVALSIYRLVAERRELAFPIPHFVVEVLCVAVFWVAVAFFFGYYYRCLKGSSGLSKGVALSIALVLPQLVLRLLLADQMVDLRYFFYWAGQVFAFCTVLGVTAFDYETLRRNGYSWQHLTALHNVPALSAFGSSLAAAIIPALVAIFQGKVADVMKLVLGGAGNKTP